MTSDGRNYTGTTNKPKSSALDCKDWKSLGTDCKHPYGLKNGNFPGGSIAGAVNYCRNPTHPDDTALSQYHTLWCIYHAPKSGYCDFRECDVPMCGECM